MMDLLTGPYSYIPRVTFIDVNGNNIYENGIDTPLDTAINYLGPIGIKIYPGAMNLNSTSFTTHQNSNGSEPANIIEARNCMLGLYKTGVLIDPCTWPLGAVVGGVPCNEVNPYFWCSGDPVTNNGWIAAHHLDVRGVGSIGPFNLIKNQEMEISVGYEIDQGSTPLGAITAVKVVSDYIQNFYENNFGYPIVALEDEVPVISGFNLEQNYPNPFNANTKIKFNIPSNVNREISNVNLTVYDVLGNEVVTLVNEVLPPGAYEVNFNANSSSSGIYFYTLRAGSFILTKKMILLK